MSKKTKGLRKEAKGKEGGPESEDGPRSVKDTPTGTLEYAGQLVAMGTMGYKHEMMAGNGERTTAVLSRAQINLKIIPMCAFDPKGNRALRWVRSARARRPASPRCHDPTEGIRSRWLTMLGWRSSVARKRLAQCWMSLCDSTWNSASCRSRRWARGIESACPMAAPTLSGS